jgi:hypothetical protein
MPEPLTLALISELMPKLYAAFPRTIRGDQRLVLDTYRNGLRGITGDAVRWAVDRTIQEDTYFPKVARLRELAAAWQRTNAPSLDFQPRDVPWNVCPVCGAKAATRIISRQKRDPEKNWAIVRDAKGASEWDEVESSMLYMDHDPAKHHVAAATEAEV